MGENLEYLNMFAQFPIALRRFLKHRLTLEEARRIVRERMELRAENLLRLAAQNIYNYPRSPYLALLEHAGCELGDLRALVKAKGLEGALRELRAAGVYIAFEEFKGRKPIVRNGLQLRVTERDFDNPFARRDFTLPTGGSTGRASSVGVDLDHIAAHAPNQLITLSAQGLLNVPNVIWYGILPDFTPSKLLLQFYIDQVPKIWFSHIGWRDSSSWLKYDAATSYILFWMRIFGAKTALPRIVRLGDAHIIARTVAALSQVHGQCFLSTQISRAVRVAVAARQAGLDFTGVTIRGGGEPITPGKVRAIEQSGARYLSNYATTDTGGALASGCARPADAGDVHLHKDNFALVTFPHPVESFGVTVPAFNVTTLSPTAPKLMLNVELDDYGVVEERGCGCELETYGYTTHLRGIRSFSKLTGEGVTLIGDELIRILDQVLPARFGGSPLDYQWVEQEDSHGLTRMALIVSPRVALDDERAVIECVLNALRESSGMADAARMIWQHAETLQIKRMEPIWSGRGKLMPLHLDRASRKP
jgi:hypothetical protein